jgi:glycosyltransferase involved in cell wall biosynthesis
VNAVKTVVSIHDLIFLRYPEFYKPIDRKIYTSKFRHACRDANKIIAISQQTKSDIMEFFGTAENKIDVIYQACNEGFHSLATSSERIALKEKYGLPENYLLYVGTIEKRKNLLNLLQAIHLGKIDVPLVIVGKPTNYLKPVQDYIRTNRIENIYFLSGVPNEDLPGIYQMSTLFVYPSVFEGFGIPILEALYSKTPVITSIGSCFSEAGGKYSIYIDPTNPEEMANAITRVLSDTNLQSTMVEEGYKHALSFDHSTIASRLMNMYKQLVNE